MDSPVLSEAISYGLTSADGLFVRIKKPLDSGHFNFTYGVFKETSKQGDTVNPASLSIILKNVTL